MTKETRKTIVDALYDRYANGEISLEQRELLIRKANSMYTVTESVDNTDEETNAVAEERPLDPTQKYNMFKESVYQKYKNGDITLEMREELLQKARDKFYPSM